MKTIYTLSQSEVRNIAIALVTALDIAPPSGVSHRDFLARLAWDGTNEEKRALTEALAMASICDVSRMSPTVCALFLAA